MAAGVWRSEGPVSVSGHLTLVSAGGTSRDALCACNSTSQISTITPAPTSVSAPEFDLFHTETCRQAVRPQTSKLCLPCACP